MCVELSVKQRLVQVLMTQYRLAPNPAKAHSHLVSSMGLHGTIVCSERNQASVDHRAGRAPAASAVCAQVLTTVLVGLRHEIMQPGTGAAGLPRGGGMNAAAPEFVPGLPTAVVEAHWRAAADGLIGCDPGVG